MAEVKWIKISTTMFTSSRKIKQIEHMPEGDTILVIWLKLLLLAGNVNDGGAIYITPEIPYTEEMLADELQRPLNIVKIALSVFEKFEMIEIVDDILYLSAWEKYQNAEKLERLKELNRTRVATHREKRKMLSNGGCNVTSNADVMQCNITQPLQEHYSNATDKDIDKDIDKEIYINIVSYLNEKANTKYKYSSKKTKSHIKARLDEGFTLEDFKTVIDKKCAEWVGTEFEQYLRPETLFGTKFESYLNAKVVPKKDDTKATIDEAKTDLDDLF